MKTRVAIYGFGRLGRAVYNVAARRNDLEVVMVVTDDAPEVVAESLMADEIYATLEQEFTPVEGGFRHNERHIHVRSVKTKDIWKEHNIDVVVDTLTYSPDKKILAEHQSAGAKRVVFARKSEELATITLGANEDDLSKAKSGISAGGAESAAVTPVKAVLADAIGIEQVLVTTTDGALYGTCTSCVCDDEHECACECSGDTGCDEDCTHKDKAEHACSKAECCTRLPIPALVASVSNLVFVTKHATTVDAVNDVLRKAAQEPYYQGILAASDELVGADSVIGESVSALVDLPRTVEEGGRLVSVKLWYDREWSYANRLVELTADFGKTIKRT